MKRTLHFLAALSLLSGISLSLPVSPVRAESPVQENVQVLGDRDLVYVQVPQDASAGTVKKVMIRLGDRKQYYTLPPSFEDGAFPLNLGTGVYTVALYEQAQDNLYRKLLSTDVPFLTENPERVYLQSIQPIRWNPDQPAIRMARQLTVAAKNRCG
ncbi:hypothetical protein LJK88_34810 [Paenibacillus sp. P26]|nr:hypothetical protein LJK88_34810 [Paenibacillus sp. P26]